MTWLRFDKVGLNTDTAIDAVPPDQWHQVYGFIPRDGSMEAFGDARFIWENNTGTNGSPYALLYSPNQALSPYWVGGFGGDGQAPQVFVWLGTAAFAYTNITRAAWAALGNVSRDNAWTGGVFNGITLIHAGWNHPPEYYDTTAGGATTTALTGWAALEASVGGTVRSRSFRPYKYYIVAMNQTENAVRFPDMVRWSAAAAAGLPATWVPAAGNDAGTNYLSDTPGGIRDGAVLGESFFIYKNNAIYRMQYVGGSRVMEFDKVSASTGIMTQNCVVDIGGAHAVLTRGDVVLVDEAGQIRSIADGLVRNAIFDAIEDGQLNACFLTWNPKRKHLWVFVPDANLAMCDTAFVWEAHTGKWGKVFLGITGAGTKLATCAGIGPAAQLTGTAPSDYRAVIGFGDDTTDTLSATWLSLNDPGATVNTYVETGSQQLKALNIDMGEPDRRKLLRRIKLIGEWDAGQTIPIYVYTRGLRDTTSTTNGPYNVVGGINERVDMLLSARFFDVEIALTSNDAYTPARIRGFELEYELQGRY